MAAWVSAARAPAPPLAPLACVPRSPQRHPDPIRVLSVSPSPGCGGSRAAGRVKDGVRGRPRPLASFIPSRLRSSSSWAGQAPRGAPPAPRRRPKPRRAASAAGGRAVRPRAGARAAAPGCEPRLGALRARRGVWARGKSWLSPPRLLRKLQDSPRCREATVVFDLLRPLPWDLRLVAQSGCDPKRCARSPPWPRRVSEQRTLKLGLCRDCPLLDPPWLVREVRLLFPRTGPSPHSCGVSPGPHCPQSFQPRGWQ